LRKSKPKSAVRDMPGRAAPAPARAARSQDTGAASAPRISKSDAENVQLLSGIALQDPDSERRLEAVTLLGVSADPDVIPVLAQAISDQDEEVRIAAISALADFTEEAPVEALERALNDSSADVRYEALEVLGEFGGARAHAAIEKAANDPDEDVRWLAETLMEDAEMNEEEEDG
jgi:HEAT repeat protein